MSLSWRESIRREAVSIYVMLECCLLTRFVAPHDRLVFLAGCTVQRLLNRERRRGGREGWYLSPIHGQIRICMVGYGLSAQVKDQDLHVVGSENKTGINGWI